MPSVSLLDPTEDTDANSYDTASNDSASDNTVSDDTASDDTADTDANSYDSASDDSVSDDTASNDDASSNTASSSKNIPVTLQPPLTGANINLASQSPGDNGLNYVAPANTNVSAPSNGQVTNVWKDDKQGLSVQVQFPNGSSAVLSGLAATQVQAGDTVRPGATLGVSGSAPVHYAFQNADGNYVDPRSASQQPADLSRIGDDDTLHAAMAAAQAGPEDPEIKQRILAQLQNANAAQKQVNQQNYTQRLQNATTQYMQTKGNVPPSALAGLSAEDVQELTQPYPPQTDPATYQEYVLHPPANPVQWLTQNATKFDPKMFDTLLKKALSVNQQTTPGSVSPVSLDKQQIDTTLQQNGFTGYVNPAIGSDDAAASVTLRNDVADQLDAAQTQAGKPLSFDDKQQIIHRVLLNAALANAPQAFAAPAGAGGDVADADATAPATDDGEASDAPDATADDGDGDASDAPEDAGEENGDTSDGNDGEQRGLSPHVHYLVDPTENQSNRGASKQQTPAQNDMNKRQSQNNESQKSSSRPARHHAGVHGALTPSSAPKVKAQPQHMTVSKEMFDFFKVQEGWNGTLDKATGLWHAADNHVDGPTIGWGHKCDNCKENVTGITKAQADALLRADLASAEKSVDRIVGNHKVSQQQFDALVSFAFNVRRYQASTLMKNARVGVPATKENFTDYGSAYKHGVKIPYPAIMKRRELEWNIYSNGDYSGDPKGSKQ